MMEDTWRGEVGGGSPNFPGPPGYQIQREICQHGLAVLYQAIQMSTGRLVGIYCLKGNNPEAKSAFERDVNIRTWLNHPHLVQLYDRIDYQGRTYLIEERVEGGTLHNPLLYVGTQPIPPTVALLEEVARTVQYLHHQGFIHRNLKPENIWLVPISFNDHPEGESKKSADHRYFGIPKINRFDMAIILEEEKEKDLEHPPPIVGTLLYMAPELLSGQSPATPSTDIYALGVIFYEMLTGQRLFQFSRIEELLEKNSNPNTFCPVNFAPISILS